MPPAKKTAAPTKKRVAPGSRKAAGPVTKAAAPAKAKAVTRVIVTLKHIAAELARRHTLPKRQAEVLLGDLIRLATDHLRKGERLRLTGLGTLEVRRRAARMGRNPATGEAIQIAASKKVAFQASKALKEAV